MIARRSEALVKCDAGGALASRGHMLDNMDQTWVALLKLGPQLGEQRQRLSLTVMQAMIARSGHLYRTLAGDCSSLALTSAAATGDIPAVW